ncbi:DUF4489 domain-containing protein [Clostridium weizhouense]|uniref:DUF4489 domain-containing protein n=1 Tax=Clostridium weizhouense TaxID=2859781 RepID=A0ABS7APL7_9CLOT|nr:DUF4489 domain-containing protein [Clostridium weizhouense]MBW6410564.1 DUF4489 domain-containing protein [Clostridium weizhouense]
MNSMSKNYCYDDHDRCKHDDHCYCRKEKKPCPTIIKCNCPSSTTIPAIPTGTSNFTISSLTLNTSCLCDPCIKLEFASNVTISADFTGTINFQVFKLCKNQLNPIPVGPSWTLSIPAATGSIISLPLAFFVCDCDNCGDDCCTYTVVATNTTVIVGSVTLGNTTLGAIATCNSNNCCYN